MADAHARGMIPPDPDGPDWQVYEDWLRERLGAGAEQVIPRMKAMMVAEMDEDETDALVWERIHSHNSRRPSPYPDIFRAAIPGGWLVVASQPEGAGPTFVPDPLHRWKGGSVRVPPS